MHNTSNNEALLPFFERCASIVNTIQFEKRSKNETVFSMFSYYDGPRNMVKYRRTFFDAIYKSAFPGLDKNFNMVDLNIRQDLMDAAMQNRQLNDLARNNPEYYVRTDT